MERRAQVALEYLMVAGFAMLVILPAAYFFYNYSRTSQRSVDDALISKLARDIVNNGESVYYLGYPSQVVLDETMPEGVVHMYSFRDWTGRYNELVLWTYAEGAYTDRFYASRVPIMGFFDNYSWSAGKKKVRVAASMNNSGSPFVLISFRGDCIVSVRFDVDNDGVVAGDDFTKCASPECYGRHVEGVCEACDYNGNCEVDGNDLIMWNILTKGNSPPYAEIVGPSTVARGSPADFVGSAFDVDGNVDSIRIMYSGISGDNWQEIKTCNTVSASTYSCSASFDTSALSPGEYYVKVEAADSLYNPATGAGKCSGDPVDRVKGVADCGFRDFIRMRVVG